MSLIPREPETSHASCSAHYVLCCFIGLCALVAASLLGYKLYDIFLIKGKQTSQFGYELLPLIAAPAISIISYSFYLLFNSKGPFTNRCIEAGLVSTAIGGVAPIFLAKVFIFLL